ncbi:hypothetical protein ACVPOS_12970 [Staphylococcus aureus]
MVTGIDLVKLQLQVAMGDVLPYKQCDTQLNLELMLKILTRTFIITR